jgi:hypothetical protein
MATVENRSITFLKSPYVSMIQQNNVRILSGKCSVINSSKVNYVHDKSHPLGLEYSSVVEHLPNVHKALD